MSAFDEDDDVELVPVPMGRETRRRLARLAEIVEDGPTRVAASLLRDLLRDDEDAHKLNAPPARRLNS